MRGKQLSDLTELKQLKTVGNNLLCDLKLIHVFPWKISLTQRYRRPGDQRDDAEHRSAKSGRTATSDSESGTELEATDDAAKHADSAGWLPVGSWHAAASSGRTLRIIRAQSSLQRRSEQARASGNKCEFQRSSFITTK